MKKIASASMTLLLMAMLAGCSDPEPAAPVELPFSAGGSLRIVTSSPRPLFNAVDGTEDNCQGESGYKDLAIDSDVKILANGQTVALGKLLRGKITEAGCKMRWKVADIPPGHTSYQFQVGHRQPNTYTKQELKDGPDMIIGSGS